MTYYDRLNEAFAFYELNSLQSSAQLVHLHLLHLNNRFGNIGQFYISDNRLSLLTGLSQDTITKAKRILKNVGLIDFESDKKKPRKGTLYILPEKILPYIWGKKQGKEQGKEQGKKRVKVGANYADNYTSINNIIIDKEKEKEGDGERACARAKPPPPPIEKFCSESLRICWIKNSGVNPNDGICQKLGELEKRYGAETVKNAIEQANYSDDGGGINLNFVISKLNGIVYSKKGEKNVSSTNAYNDVW